MESVLWATSPCPIHPFPLYRLLGIAPSCDDGDHIDNGRGGFCTQRGIPKAGSSPMLKCHGEIKRRSCVSARLFIRSSSQFHGYVRIQHALRVGWAWHDVVNRGMACSIVGCLCQRYESFPGKETHGLELLLGSSRRQSIPKFANAAINALPSGRLRIFCSARSDAIYEGAGQVGYEHATRLVCG
jgi:hypothetical protein